MQPSQPSTFSPSPAQRRLLDHMQANPCLRTIGELCDKVGISRMTYYRWSKDPDFRLWFARAWSAHLIMDGVVLLNQARLLATRQFSYWKALFNLTFDPKGLPLLQQWQQNCAQLDSDAFTHPDAQPDNVTGQVLADQPKPPANVTKSQPSAGPELPQQHGARSQGQACEIRNGAPLPGSDPGEGARSKWREAAAGADRAGACGVPGPVERQAGRVAKPLGVPRQSTDGEGVYTDVRDRAGYGEPRKDAAARLLSPRPAPFPTPVQHVRTLRQLVRMAPTRSDLPPAIP